MVVAVAVAHLGHVFYHLCIQVELTRGGGRGLHHHKGLAGSLPLAVEGAQGLEGRHRALGQAPKTTSDADDNDDDDDDSNNNNSDKCNIASCLSLSRTPSPACSPSPAASRLEVKAREPAAAPS